MREHLKTCRTCRVPKAPEAMVSFKRGAKTYLRSKCLACKAGESRAFRKEERPSYLAAQKRQSDKEKAERISGARREHYIWTDSRRSDKKAGRSHDLSKMEILELIASGCSYCGERTLQMTLDRLDNDLGHIRSNVVAACVRCNYMRRDMPLVAWNMLVASIRGAREAGAFANWIGGISQSGCGTVQEAREVEEESLRVREEGEGTIAHSNRFE